MSVRAGRTTGAASCAVLFNSESETVISVASRYESKEGSMGALLVGALQNSPRLKIVRVKTRVSMVPHGAII